MSTGEHETGQGGTVPAVARAVRAIERLRALPEGASLARLSRELGVSPSSLLTILRTLTVHGYVLRDARGTYRLGPAVAELGGEQTAVAAVREAVAGVSALAGCLALGPAAATAAGDRREALRALGLAARHLADVLLDDAGPAAAERGDDAGRLWRAEASGPLVGEELDEFLAGAWLATLAFVRDSGYPYSVPIWYHWAGGRFWIAPRPGAEWAAAVSRHPHVSLAIGEPEAPLRRVLVEGEVVPVEGPAAAERTAQMVARMAERYLGTDAPAYLAATGRGARRLFSLIPAKVVTWRGLAPHPRYAAEPAAPAGEGVA